MNVFAIILAAGSSSRMGSPKALLTISGETFLEHLVRVFGACAAQVAVVIAPGAEAVRSVVPDGVMVVVNPEPERGQLSSLQCALGHLPADADAVLFCPVDIPSVREQTVRALIGNIGHSDMAVPRYQGRHGHPVVFRSALAARFVDAQGSARDVVHAHAGNTTYVDVDDPGILRDIDTPNEYRQFTGDKQ